MRTGQDFPRWPHSVGLKLKPVLTMPYLHTPTHTQTYTEFELRKIVSMFISFPFLSHYLSFLYMFFNDMNVCNVPCMLAHTCSHTNMCDLTQRPHIS